MKEYLASLVRASPDQAQSRRIVREYLQARILESLQRCGAMIPLAFHGGSALRFLYSLPRHSEDLDFALERTTAPYQLDDWLRAIRSTLAAEGYQVEVRLNDRRVVHSAFVRFPGLLHELDLSPHATEAIAVKIEVDTHPPTGAGLATTLIRRLVTLRLQHHDQPSLLAGKLHSVLQRPYAKGRDIYDLMWYLASPDWPAPNLILLNNALAQTGWSGPVVDDDNWRAVVRSRLEALDWSRVVEDARPFVEQPHELDLMTRENVLGLLE
jgi:hypothetical protein